MAAASLEDYAAAADYAIPEQSQENSVLEAELSQTLPRNHAEGGPASTEPAKG